MGVDHVENYQLVDGLHKEKGGITRHMAVLFGIPIYIIVDVQHLLDMIRILANPVGPVLSIPDPRGEASTSTEGHP